MVFFLSCKGNMHGDEAAAGGVVSYLGFDDVPFARFNPITEQMIQENSLTAHCQSLIAEAAFQGIRRIAVFGESLGETAKFLQLWVRQKAVEFVRSYPSERYRNDIAAMFMIMADSVRVAGRPDAKLDVGKRQ